MKIGDLEVRAVRSSKSTISVCISAPSDDVKQVWEVTSEVYSDMESIIEPLLGLIKMIFFECTHCIVEGLEPVEQRSPSEVLKAEGPDVTYDTCKEIQIPRALVNVSLRRFILTLFYCAQNQITNMTLALILA